MSRPAPEAARYIRAQFTAYARHHLGNPVAPYTLYLGFLDFAKTHGQYGLMRLAKEHKTELLATGYTLLVGVYGKERIKKLMPRKTTPAPK